MAEDNVRDLIEAIEPRSILPDVANAASRNDVLASVFRSRERVYFTGDRVPAWWTPQRDVWMWQLLLGSDLLSSVAFSTSARLASIPINVEPADKTNRNHRRLALWSHRILQYYWSEVAFQVAMDWQTNDNGAFVEVMGAGDPAGPLEPTLIPGTKDYLFATGLRVLDSHKCTRTGDPEFPVVYMHKPLNGPEKAYKFHQSRIINLTQMASTRRNMLGVGLSATSRCVRSILRLDDVNLLEDELLGSRPISQLIFSRAIGAEDMENAFGRADAKLQDAVALGDRKRSARTVFISAEGPPEMVKASSIEAIDLKRLPEGYSAEIYMSLVVNNVSTAFGFDVREIWPATVRGATKADAEVQDLKSRRRTPGLWINAWEQQLARKWCPMTTMPLFDAQDDEADALRAAIHKQHADTIAIYLNAKAIDAQAAWEMMLEEGDISETQYRRLLQAEQFQLEAEQQRIAAERARVDLEIAKKPPAPARPAA